MKGAPLPMITNHSVMKRLCFVKFLMVLLLFLYPGVWQVKAYDVERAKKLASSVIQANDLSLVKSTSAYDIFSSAENNSFVIVSVADDGAEKVIGYSDSGIWDDSNMPPALLSWLNSLSRVALHRSPANSRSNRTTEQRVDIPVLMKSKWHQSSPYNDLCPVITDGNVKTAAGCVAIAASQVAYYWRRDNPLTTAEATPVYPYGKAPVTYSIPEGTSFDWDSMRDSYEGYESEEERNAVARLVYLMGTSTYLQYGVSTGGHIKDILSPYSKQIRLNGKYEAKRDYTQEEWEQLIYDNLVKKQPVVYSGSTGSDGHAVVIDGYDATRELFHFNFGWGGSGDGYYTVNDETGMNGYNQDQACVKDIYPKQRNRSAAINISGNIISNQENSIEIVISNNSTLDIENLYLFLMEKFQIPANKEKAVWVSSTGFASDGEERYVTATFSPDKSGTNYSLVLTDENLNLLSQKRIDIIEGSGIIELRSDDIGQVTYYTIDGMKLSEKPSSGIYIRRQNDVVKKMLTR